jgi:hypothetical protein
LGLYAGVDGAKANVPFVWRVILILKTIVNAKLKRHEEQLHSYWGFCNAAA